VLSRYQAKSFSARKKTDFAENQPEKKDSAAETKIMPGERVYGKITKIKELAGKVEN